jgi:shikimate kinase
VELIFLCGLSGSGKSTVGKQLAERLQFSFVDLDYQIEIEANQSIGKIFETKGESVFRRLESDALLQLCETSTAVIALGAGALENPENLRQVLVKGILVYLRAPVSVLAARLAESTERPLLSGGNRDEILTEMLSQREAAYLKAHIIVDVSDKTIEQTVFDLAAEFQKC